MNLDEIIDKHTMHELWLIEDRAEIKQCMRIAVKQALELAAERAEIRRYSNGAEAKSRKLWVDDPYNLNIEVDKQSILSIIDEIEE